MKLEITKHEDNRRVLTEWINGLPFKRCKVIEVKERSILGNHYHLKNDSAFYVMKGKATYWLKSLVKDKVIDRGWLFEGEGIYVERGLVHTFEVYPGTIMLESASEPFDKSDEIPHEIQTTK